MITSNQNLFLIIARNLVFWAISFIVLVHLFSYQDEINRVDLVYTLLFHVPLVLGLVLHKLALHSSFNQGRYGVYAFQVLIIASLLIPQAYFLTFNVLAEWVFSGFYFVAVYSWLEMTGIGGVYLSVTFLFHIAFSWYRQQEEIKKVGELKEQKKTAELQALRAQINPHFLFNTLNTIYGETLRKSEKAPSLILQLSEILRYVVDTSQEEEVPLKDELTYIQNYVKLQQERFNRPDQISLNIDGDPEKRKIAPLLLITFIENCFKHGRLTRESDFIRISISVNSKSLELTTSNTCKTGHEISTTNSTGLANTRKRLELRYKGRYQMSSARDGDSYQSTLILSFNHAMPDH